MLFTGDLNGDSYFMFETIHVFSAAVNYWMLEKLVHITYKTTVEFAYNCLFVCYILGKRIEFHDWCLAQNTKAAYLSNEYMRTLLELARSDSWIKHDAIFYQVMEYWFIHPSYHLWLYGIGYMLWQVVTNTFDECACSI